MIRQRRIFVQQTMDPLGGQNFKTASERFHWVQQKGGHAGKVKFPASASSKKDFLFPLPLYRKDGQQVHSSSQVIIRYCPRSKFFHTIADVVVTRSLPAPNDSYPFTRKFFSSLPMCSLVPGACGGSTRLIHLLKSLLP